MGLRQDTLRRETQQKERGSEGPGAGRSLCRDRDTEEEAGLGVGR